MERSSESAGQGEGGQDSGAAVYSQFTRLPWISVNSVGKIALLCTKSINFLFPLFSQQRVTFQGKWLSDYLSPLLGGVYVGGGD